MIPLPRIAPAEIRLRILDALGDPVRRFIHRDSLRFLHLIDLREDELVRDLIHITLAPDGGIPPRVRISVHRHNIPGPPLPLIPIPDKP